MAGLMPEYLGKGGSLEYMSTVIFHFLFCFRILLVIIERFPISPLSLSQQSTYEELLLKRYDDDHGDLAHAQTPRSALLRVRLLLQLGGSRIPIDTTCAFYTPIHTQPAGLVGLGC